ncbi:MAG: CotH kinase family protein, partial [Prevotella sp.]
MPIHGQKLGFPLWSWGIVVLLLLTVSCRRTPKQQEPKLPVIYVNTDKEIPWEKRIPCTVAVVTECDSTVWGGKVKFRGGISSKYYKHSYSLKLAEAHSLCGLPANRSWILNASYIDKTFMRHKLCYDLFHMMDSNNLAPQCRYALVRENGQPQGLYVVMERLNKTSLHVDPDDTAAVIFKEPKIFYRDSQLPNPAPFGDNYHEQTYPDFEKGDRSYLMDDFRRFLSRTPDSEFYAHIGEWIDIHNLIDWHLLLLFTNGGDGVKKNFYLYRRDSQTPYRIALWDCDHSFGRDGDNEKNMLERLLDDRQNILLDRMLKSQEYQNALAKRYRELRKSGVFSYQTIEKMMQENDPWVRLGLDENTRLWPFD